MNDTLCIRFKPTPSSTRVWYFERRIAEMLSNKYLGNDRPYGSKIMIPAEEVGCFENILSSNPSVCEREIENLEEIINILKEGHSIDMWLAKGLMRKEIFI